MSDIRIKTWWKSNTSICCWLISFSLLGDVWYLVWDPGNAEGWSQSETVWIGGRWESFDYQFVLIHNLKGGWRLHHRKVTFIGKLSGVWTKIRKDVVCDSGFIRSPLLLHDHEMTKNCPPIISSLQSAPERDECTGDPVPDRALLQGECWGAGCPSMCPFLSFLFPFLYTRTHHPLLCLPRWPKRTKSWRGWATCWRRSSPSCLKT